MSCANTITILNITERTERVNGTGLLELWEDKENKSIVGWFNVEQIQFRPATKRRTKKSQVASH
uniref:Uncharacterized protein n=1 Tax=Oryza glumipatula TaxID=40148 RepID=A0A0D9ZDP1_9ORYZ